MHRRFWSINLKEINHFGKLVTQLLGIGGSYPGVKRPGLKAEHSPPSSAEVKSAWSYTSTLHYVLVAWCLIKQWIRLHDVVLS
jgi:hypothetical protein